MLGSGQNKVAIVDRDTIARVVIHVYNTLLITQTIGDIVTHHLLPAFILRFAAHLPRCLRIGILHVFLDPVAGVSASSGSADCRHDTAVAASDLIAKQTADHRTNGCTGNAITITGRCLVTNEYVLADLARCL